jgi:hypothetical protein
MSDRQNRPSSVEGDQVWEEIARLLALQIRLQVENQTAAILALHRAGFSPPRITQLLGLSQDTARATIHQAKGSTAKKGSHQDKQGLKASGDAS